MATRTRRSGLDRVCEYFETVSDREAEAAFMLVSKIMAERNGTPAKRKPRAPKAIDEAMPGYPADEESPIAAARAKRAAATA